MRRIVVGALSVMGAAILVCTARAGFFGSDGKVGTWRAIHTLVESSTGEHLVFRDVSCGTRTLTDIWNGGGGGLGPYLRSDQADIMRAATAALVIDASDPEVSQPLLTLRADGEQLAVFDSGGQFQLNGFMKQPSGVIRKFQNENNCEEVWDADEQSLIWSANATPAVEVDFDDRYLGVRGGIGAYNYTMRNPDSGTIRFFENSSTYTEYWDASENVLSLRANATPVACLDLDTGDAHFGGDISITADRKLTQPPDSAGTGPFILSGLVKASLSGFTLDPYEGYHFTTSSGQVTLGSIPEKIYGGDVFVDRLIVYGATASPNAYIDSIQLRCADRASSSYSVATYTSDIGNGSDGEFAADILSSPVSRESAPGLWFLAFVIVDPYSDGIYLSDVAIHYHLQ